MACHETPSFKTSFWTNIYTKVMLMQMKAEESREDAEADQGICDLCKVLEEADEGV